MSINPDYRAVRVKVEDRWLYVKPEDIRNNKVSITEYSFEGYPLRDPITREVEIRKPLDQRITEYLDRCGVLSEGMRRDITAMIKEEEEQ